MANQNNLIQCSESYNLREKGFLFIIPINTLDLSSQRMSPVMFPMWRTLLGGWEEGRGRISSWARTWAHVEEEEDPSYVTPLLSSLCQLLITRHDRARVWAEGGGPSSTKPFLSPPNYLTLRAAGSFCWGFTGLKSDEQTGSGTNQERTLTWIARKIHIYYSSL